MGKVDEVVGLILLAEEFLAWNVYDQTGSDIFIGNYNVPCLDWIPDGWFR